MSEWDTWSSAARTRSGIAARTGSGISRIWLAAARLWFADRRPSTFTVALRKRFLLYFALIATCWLPWIALTWPGAMRDDTMAQYLQAMGLHHYYTQHPLFDTLIFGLFWRFGAMVFGSPLAGQAAYTIAQALALAAGGAFILCYIRKLGAPLWLVTLGLVYAATSYVVVGATTTMGKDSLHTVFFLPMAVIFTETCLTRGRVLRRMPVAVAFTLFTFASVASKRTALPIVVCGGIGLLCVCAGRKSRASDRAPAESVVPRLSESVVPRLSDRARAAICLIVAVLLAQAVFAPIAAAATHASKSPGREVWGIVTQPVARLAHDDPSAITPAQRRALNGIMDLDKAAAAINPHRTDETFHTLKEPRRDADGTVIAPGPTSAQKLAAVRAWARLGLSHPLVYARTYAAQTRGWWDPNVNFAYPTDSDYLLRDGYLRQWSTYLTAAEVRRAGGGIGGNETSANPATSGESARMTAIARDLAPLAGTSDRLQWQRDTLRAVRDWARGANAGTVAAASGTAARPGNPLTSMALYVTWIPLMIALALIAEAVMMRHRRRGDSADSRDSRDDRESRADSDASEPMMDGSGVDDSRGGATASIGPRLAAFGLLVFTVMSLYASPEALFWYPIPVFTALPLFTTLPFLRGDSELAPTR
ncbi:DUF6020 family protein [Bifidobacterium stellenboschense]|uniref:Sortase B cell surface sorting signal n=1 Tax=Bifidobacterium stellenboschense TaxID=762211 RepID=A0A087DIB9_9BIFI|nr:DUF6020 family protein [Bifidobacterium stellenboschense]KFI95269.1 sortase B cell surface sorting signal [Bifidobacterium stellenboschense]